MAERVRVLATGTIMVDVLAVGLPHIAEPSEVVYTPNDIETRIGGHPIDVAIDLIELGMAPSEVAVAAAVGRGPYADLVRQVMEEHGVNALLQDVPDHDTGKNLVLAVTGEDRRFHLDPGANWHLDPAHVISSIHGLRPEVFCLRPGYSGIDLALDQVLSAADGTVVFLDVMVPHPDRPKGFLESIFPKAHLVHGNERELKAVTGSSTVDVAIDRLIESGVALVLVTSGERGARAVTPDFEVTQPAFQVEVVDATGCGDAFCAGVVYELTRRFPTVSPGSVPHLDVDAVAQMLAMAQATGASAATKAGCVEGVSGEKVRTILSEQGERILASTASGDRRARR